MTRDPEGSGRVRVTPLAVDEHHRVRSSSAADPVEKALRFVATECLLDEIVGEVGLQRREL